MKIFKVERTDVWDYDDYSDFVCIANSEDEARRMYPDDNYYVWMDDGFHMKYSDGKIDEKLATYFGWTHAIDTLTVIEINPQTATKPEIVCASYHAG